ncbi:AMP-binding protein [Roseovarius aestuariivivens]|uniref:AMP-binding protein n=1 Tax=Roseovarius aestuariivivens TaxID=1888910 RepID=UPI0010807CC7|nr:AMP-binding protein [Roseovarius aestuariivivens]
MGWMKDETGLDKNAANFVPMTPLSHLYRASHVFPDTEALVYGNTRRTFKEYYERCTKLASALAKAGVNPGDVVATLLPNLPAHAETLFGVPACGAVVNTINTRLEADTISYIFEHGEAKIVLVDPQFMAVTKEAIDKMEGPAPRIIEVADPEAGLDASGEHTEYEEFLATGDADFAWIMPKDEWESLALNYTSGTTGRPKGVVYHHRGAYILTMGTAVDWPLPRHARYLTIVPLFHCNNWCHTWAMPLVGGTVVCCRDITAANIYNAIADEGVTHFGAAPIVLNMIVNAKDAERRAFEHQVNVFTAGAPPPAATLRAIEPLGFSVTQVYGLTETYGHVTECVWQDRWEDLKDEERYAIKARTGVLMGFMEEITSMDPETMEQVPLDGETQGEIMIRGNAVMKGYYKNPEATAESFRGGYFHSGDIAYQHEDGYLKIADRAKDIIISGGENISSVEIEGVLMMHPSVLLCAVVAMPDEKWGEVPCAFVEVKESATVTEEDLIAFAREKLAGFKSPKKVMFQELPKTSTGKIQKFELRKAFKSG